MELLRQQGVKKETSPLGTRGHLVLASRATAGASGRACS